MPPPIIHKLSALMGEAIDEVFKLTKVAREQGERIDNLEKQVERLSGLGGVAYRTPPPH